MRHYGVHARDYVKRARARLAEAAPEALFYAALELRSGIESRMQQYLTLQSHLPKAIKKGWRIAKLGKSLEKAFRSGDRVIRLTVLAPETGETKARYFYTPVTRELPDIAEKLGDYLHAQPPRKVIEDGWWADFRSLVKFGCALLEDASYGTLIGPPLHNPKTGQGRILLEPQADLDPVERTLQFAGSSGQFHFEIAEFDSLADARDDAP